LIALSATSIAEGTWIRAERQSGGKGRMGRRWESPVGNLYASTLVRLQTGDPPVATLALVSAIALHQVISAFAPNCGVQIKWPNDVLADGAKLAGILLERSDNAVVIGFGVNLAIHPAQLDRAVTSIAALGCGAPDPENFAYELASAFERGLAVWRGIGLPAVIKHWLAAAHPIGTALTARLANDETYDGVFDGLAADGALRLRLADGAVRVIHAGDVFLL
jgi:BirA family transcriptional regulator, biotin operon repressor / biotin---[acetyl-CoA-carboxylase] ligase